MGVGGIIRRSRIAFVSAHDLRGPHIEARVRRDGGGGNYTKVQNSIRIRTGPSWSAYRSALLGGMGVGGIIRRSRIAFVSAHDLRGPHIEARW